VTRISISCDTQLACSRREPRAHEYISLVRIFLCCTVEYGLPVVIATSFLCFSSVTDHLLSFVYQKKVPRNIIVPFYRWNVLFFYSRKINQRRIQNQLEA